MKMKKIPILLVNNDKWSRDTYVVFEDTQILGYCIPDEWITRAYNEATETGMDIADDLTREQIADEMESNFFSENCSVEKFWPEHQILMADGDYYSYDDDGTVEYLTDTEALEIMPAVHAARVTEWQQEQAQIEGSEIVTPRQAGLTDHFGIDPTEQAELADDKKILRNFHGRLYVFEGQLGEPAQWRLFLSSPHGPTGTLPRPEGA